MGDSRKDERIPSSYGSRGGEARGASRAAPLHLPRGQALPWHGPAAPCRPTPPHRTEAPPVHRLASPWTLALLVLLPILGTAHPVAAGQSEEDPVTVGVRVAPPFVLEEDGVYSGLTIALWEHVAGELELDFRYEERDIEGLLDGVGSGELFAAAAALTITSEREEQVDFTHPFFVSGLGIAVPHETAGLSAALRALFDPEFLWVVGLLFGLLLFWGVLVWVFERVENREEFGGTAVEGIGSGFWWAAVTMTTVGYGDKSPRTLGGRIVGFVWMFSAVIVISFFTASIASSLTVTQLDSQVTGPRDLPHVRVGALAGSATLDWLDEERIRADTFESLAAGLAAVEDGAIDAFVHDAPILRYLTGEDFRNRVRVLPGTFAQQYYGIALPLDVPERNQINQVLLDWLVSPEWERLNQRYLGEG
ncbi:MAG: ABC transporter substrate-binding protein [Gemmatimonadales bacterium]|nr:MAG: ABC transporter substrate-binding protein [Gemmatimonadales bacterium]